MLLLKISYLFLIWQPFWDAEISNLFSTAKYSHISTNIYISTFLRLVKCPHLCQSWLRNLCSVYFGGTCCGHILMLFAMCIYAVFPLLYRIVDLAPLRTYEYLLYKLTEMICKQNIHTVARRIQTLPHA